MACATFGGGSMDCQAAALVRPADSWVYRSAPVLCMARDAASIRAVRCERGELPPPDRTLHKTGKDIRLGGMARGLRELRLLEHFGMRPSSDLLDVGCGIGRLAYECAWFLDDDASYVGLDIAPTVIDWLNTNYAPRLPGFRFDFLDVYNESYRPTGAVGPEHVRFPYEDEQFDVVCAFEVFMHISLEGIRNYLREMVRVLRSGGLAVVTFVAVYPDEPVSFDAEYVEVRRGIYTTRPDGTSSDMAYDIDLVRSAVTDVGLDEVGSVKGRTHTPIDRRPGVAPGIELPSIYHPCDLLAGRKATKISRRGRSRRRLQAKTPPTAGSGIQAIEPTDARLDSNVTPAPAVPGAPTIRSVTGGNGSGTVSWTAPASDGGSPVTGYAVTACVLDRQAKTRIFNSTATTQTVTGLINGAEHRFWVRAYNAVGIERVFGRVQPDNANRVDPQLSIDTSSVARWCDGSATPWVVSSGATTFQDSLEMPVMERVGAHGIPYWCGVDDHVIPYLAVHVFP